MKLRVENDYEFGDIVYLKTDKEQYPLQIVSLRLDKNGVKYGLADGVDLDYYYSFQFSKEKTLHF